MKAERTRRAATKRRTGAAGCAAAGLEGSDRPHRWPEATHASDRYRRTASAGGTIRGSVPLNSDRPEASVRQMADSSRRDIPPFFGSLASVRHSSHRRVRQASDTYAIWLTRQHTGFTPLFPASPRGLPHTVCSLKEIITTLARPSRSAGITGIARSLADPWQPRPRRVPYGKMLEEHDNLTAWLAPLPRCHTIFPHHISHMTAAVWQVFYLAC